MKKTLSILFLSGLTFYSVAQSKKEVMEENEKLKKGNAALTEELTQLKKEMEVDLTQEEAKFSYAIGLSFANNLKSQGVESIDAGALSKALKDVNSGNLEMSLDEANQIIQTYLQAAQSKKFEVNKKEGEEFLAANAKKEGVVTLASGMQYEILKEGTGAKPQATDKVTTHYHGTLINGAVFDSSVDRGQPSSFPVNGVIQGWQEALQLMPVGSKWKLYIPYNLAYGERGAGASIPPFTTLVFEVELISID